MRRIGILACTCLSLGAYLCLGVASPAFADEPYLEFLQGLRERGYYDMALEYLDEIQEKSSLPADVRQILPYERAQLLFQSATHANNVDAQTRLLDAAQAAFTAFLAENPEHALAGEANSALARILLERANTKLRDAELPSNAGIRSNMQRDAREMIFESRRVFQAAHDLYKAKWEKFPSWIPREDVEQIEASLAAQRRYIQAQLYLARTWYFQSHTYDQGTEERTKQLKQAADLFEAIASQNHSMASGLHAELMQGICYQEQGEIGIALGIYHGLLQNPGNSAGLREVRDNALRNRLICLNDESRKEYEIVVEEGEAWLRDNVARQRTDAGVGIQWEVAQAHEALAEQRTTSELIRKNHLNQALNLARTLMRGQSEFKTPASSMVQRISVALNRTPGPPQDFETASQLGNQLFGEVSAVQAALVKAQQAGDADAIRKQGDALVATAAEMTRMYELAVKLAAPETEAAFVNAAWFRLSYAYYLQKKYFDASVVAEFQMEKFGEAYPDTAREAGFVAMSAMESAYRQADEDHRDFERERLLELSRKLAERWPESDRANDARDTIARILNGAGQRLEAADWWNRIPEGTSKYGVAQVNAGMAVWSHYAAQSALPEEHRPDPTELQTWKNEAVGYFERAIQVGKSDYPAGTTLPIEYVQAKLNLANIRNQDGIYQTVEGGPTGALELLTQPPHAPAEILADPETNPIPGTRTLAQYTFQQLLRTQIGLKDLDGARAAREKLEDVAAGEDDAALTQVFIAFGKELQQELERLKAANETERLLEVRNGFESFLNDLLSRQDGQTLYSLLWIGETFTSLAEGSSDAPDTASVFYRKAATAYQSILDQAAADPAFATTAQLDACRLRLANCLISQKDYPRAENLVLQLIRARPQAPEPQFEAARLYQEWAQTPAENSWVRMKVALYGREDPVHVWGWSYLAQSLQRAQASSQDPRLLALMFDARYALAKAEKILGEIHPDPKERKNHLERAQAAIVGFQRVSKRWPDEQYVRFNDLYRDVQADMKVPIVDLPRQLADSGGGEELVQPPQTDVASTPVGSDTKPAEESSRFNLPLMGLIVLLGAAVVAGLFWFSLRQQKRKYAAYEPLRKRHAQTHHEPTVNFSYLESMPVSDARKAARPRNRPAGAPGTGTPKGADRPQRKATRPSGESGKKPPGSPPRKRPQPPPTS